MSEPKDCRLNMPHVVGQLLSKPSIHERVPDEVGTSQFVKKSVLFASM